MLTDTHDGRLHTTPNCCRWFYRKVKSWFYTDDWVWCTLFSGMRMIKVLSLIRVSQSEQSKMAADGNNHRGLPITYLGRPAHFCLIVSWLVLMLWISGKPDACFPASVMKTAAQHACSCEAPSRQMLLHFLKNTSLSLRHKQQQTNTRTPLIIFR